MKKFLLMIMIVLLAGCKTIQYVPVETIKKEYIHNTDSIYILDSIYYYIHTKNDTVYVDKDRWHIRNIIKNDTVYVCDSIPKPYPVEVVKTTNIIYNWQWALMTCGVLFVIYILSCVVRKVRKWF